MKLYDFEMAPNPRRVRIFMAEKGIDCDRVQVDLRAREQLEDDYLKINPLGTVPCLELDDGTRLVESVAICRYLEETHPEPNLMGATPVEKAEIEAWQRHCEFNGFAPVGEAYRNSQPFFDGHALAGSFGKFDRIPELVERCKARVALFFDRLDERLGETGYVAGDRFTIADITAACALDFAMATKVYAEGSADLANLNRWHGAVSARPSFRANPVKPRD